MMGLVDASVRNGPPSSVTDSSGSGDVRPPSAAASAVSTPGRRGKREGAKNFTPTDAAVGVDQDDGQQPDVDGDGVDGVADQNSAGIPNLALAQRPSIGKKKAKNIKFEKEQTNEAPLAMLGQWMQQMAKAQEDRLSVAREKTRIARNKFLTSLFTEDDQEHSEFIRLQREQALLEARLEVAKKRNELAQWEERH